MSRRTICCLVAVFIIAGYWLRSSAADPRDVPAARDLQSEVDQLRSELNELRSRLEALEGASAAEIVQPAGGPSLAPSSPFTPPALPEINANPIPVPRESKRPSWAPEGSIPGEINGHTFYIIPLNGNDRATIRHP